jgi:tRNA nucleotidyltransferase (CCA-adding enzyme)
MIVKSIGNIAEQLGFRSYVIGGCVRDLILKRDILDLDVAVEGDAVSVARTFALQYRGRIVVYPSFATATVTGLDGRTVDFSMIRKERYASPGALPIVSPGELSDDLLRRDFTINAMALALHPDHLGELIDMFGGLSDLKSGKIRVMHEKSFVDDPTRILRAVRFEQRFGFKIEAQTLRWIRLAIRIQALKSVKPQRLFQEFKKNLHEVSAGKNVARLSALAFFKSADWGCRYANKQREVFRRIDSLLHWTAQHIHSSMTIDRWLVYWMALGINVESSQWASLQNSLAVSRDDQDKLQAFRKADQIISKLKSRNCSRGETFKILQVMSLEEVVFLAAQVKSDIVLDRIKWFLTKGRQVTLKINGDDLKRLGVPSGKVFKAILQEVLYEVIEGRCATKLQQVAFARQWYQLNQPRGV